MYAVIETGGKQEIIEQDEIIRIEKLDNKVGENVEFDKVLMIRDEKGEVELGTPYLEDTKVVGVIVRQDREKKIIVFKKKRRKGYKKTAGHRQYFSEVKIIDIFKKGKSLKTEAKPEGKKGAKKEVKATAKVVKKTVKSVESKAEVAKKTNVVAAKPKKTVAKKTTTAAKKGTAAKKTQTAKKKTAAAKPKATTVKKKAAPAKKKTTVVRKISSKK